MISLRRKQSDNDSRIGRRRRSRRHRKVRFPESGLVKSGSPDFGPRFDEKDPFEEFLSQGGGEEKDDFGTGFDVSEAGDDVLEKKQSGDTKMQMLTSVGKRIGSSLKDSFMTVQSKVSRGVKIGAAVTILAVVVITVYWYSRGSGGGDAIENGSMDSDSQLDWEEQEMPKRKNSRKNKKKGNAKRVRFKDEEDSDAEEEEDEEISRSQMLQAAFKDYSDRLWQLRSKGVDLFKHVKGLEQNVQVLNSRQNSFDGEHSADPSSLEVDSDGFTSDGQGFGSSFMLPEQQEKQAKATGFQLEQMEKELVRAKQELAYMNNQYNVVMDEFTNAFGMQERKRMEDALRNV